MVMGTSSAKRQDEPDDEEDEEEYKSNRELFSGLLGNGDENAFEIKERKRKEKQALVAQI